MKKILFIIPVLAATLAMVSSCNNDDTWSDYSEWREANNEWLLAQGSVLDENNQAFYTRINPSWNTSAYIYMHYFNDRSLTEGNLTPISTSTVSVKYIGRLYNNEPFDSSFLATDSLFTTKISDVISGWGIALQHMRVGDSVRVVIPYQHAYGATQSGSILPYSNLQFDIKLVDIPKYETKN